MRKASSNLLISEPPVQILPTLATKLGLNRAIFLQQLHYWLHKTEKMVEKQPDKESMYVHDGRLWIYNTYDEWADQFPFWSMPTIQRIIYGLEKDGIILTTDMYNTHRSIRTKWYTLDYEALDHLVDEVVSSD